MASKARRSRRAAANADALNGAAEASGAAPRSSAHLDRLGQEAARRDGLSLSDMIEILGPTSLPFTILLLTLPAIAPLPGPFGMVFGTCLAIVSLQILAGVRRLRLPGSLGRRRLPADAVTLVLGHASPLLRKVERRLKPGRLPALAGPVARRLLGFPVLLLAIAIALPIPFGNLVPALALIVLALALLQRDGLAVLAALAIGLAALGTTVALALAAVSVTQWAVM